ncbi:MAG: glycosyltransferase [Verrucomicrobia bacterium]|nr:glycosyltransferase [Verrucomicrobiota bacterium]
MLPRISIVIPSYNQGRFLGAALKSLVAQNYPELEILLLDAGSTDETPDVITRYQSYLAFWRSYPDRGQAAAINEGFGRATGRILCWLNSDDLHLPTTLKSVAAQLGARLDAPAVIYGGCELFRDGTPRLEIRPAVPFDHLRLQTTDFIDQPSAFWTRKAWQLVGPLDASLHYAFDWDWFLRAATAGVHFIAVPETLSRYRIHAAHKSGTGGRRRWRELLAVVHRHSSPDVVAHYEWLDCCPVAHWWLNKRMRLAQYLSPKVGSKAAGTLADLCSPPFWRAGRSLRREVFWQISGIR